MMLDHLNGWQRIWVALSTLWTLLIVGGIVFLGPAVVSVPHPMNYGQRPLHYTAADAVLARMKTPKWEGSNCEQPGYEKMMNYEQPVTLDGLSSPVHLCFTVFMPPDVGERRVRDNQRVEWDGNAWKPFTPTPTEYIIVDTTVSDAEQNAIVEDYRRAYAEERRHVKWTQRRNLVLLWIVPPVALYVLGWAVGWIWQGFRRPR